MNRRSLIRLALTATAVSPFVRLGLGAALQEFGAESLVVLRQVGRVALPAELGPAGVDAQIERFAGWIRAYRAGAEMEHGYGHPRIRYTPPSPVAVYAAQLRDIDSAARKKGQVFDRLDGETQRSILDASLKDAAVTDLPGRPMGRHVVADLMAHYLRSSEANDRAYRASIRQEQCRPITFVLERPRPL